MVVETAVPFIQSAAPNILGVLYTGPTICGFIIGFLAGLLMHKNATKGIALNTSSWIAILIGGVLVAYWLGTFPYYESLPFGPGFVMAIIGAMVGRGLFGTKYEA